MTTFAGLTLERPLIMGIVNATPDSFSDGGEAYAFDDAVARGLQMIEDGADIVDVGGESTRPGADPVSEAEELARTIPVVERLAKAAAAAGAVVSIDTRHAGVMTAAVAAGASIINDVAALREPGALDAAAQAVKTAGAYVVLMHMQGEPGTMQNNPAYADAPGEVLDFLKARVAACEAAGIPRDHMAVDPGIGFGKTTDHNLQILNRLDLYADMGLPVLLGASRKRFIGEVAHAPAAKDRVPAAKDRVPGSLAVALWGAAHGAHILRVHDVAETVQALAVWRGIDGA